MSKMIGKISGADWSEAPEGATHYKHSVFYRQHQGVWEYLYKTWWIKSSNNSNTNSWFKNAVSKDEDLQMNTKEVSKQVSSIEDLELGMFLRVDHGSSPYVICELTPNNISVVIVGSYPHTYNNTNFSNYSSWSYTYNGEYTPIVKETEADIKIKELEATIELAQKQLQEYKGMK